MRFLANPMVSMCLVVGGEGQVTYHTVPCHAIPYPNTPPPSGGGPVLAAPGRDQADHGQLPQGDRGEHTEVPQV